MKFLLAPASASGILAHLNRSMPLLTSQLVAFSLALCTPTRAPASDFVAVDLVPNPDSILMFDSLSPGTPRELALGTPLVGNYTRGIDMDTGSSGYLIHTAALSGTPTGLYRFHGGVVTLVANLPSLTESDCGFTLTPDCSTIFYSLGQPLADDMLMRCSTAGEFSPVGPIHRPDGVITAVIGLAMSASGTLYGLDTTDDSLLVVTPTTGAAVRVGSLGVPVGGEGELDFDWNTGELVMAAGQITSRIYAVNPSTGASTLLGVLPFITSAIAFAGSAGVECPMDLDNGSGSGTQDDAVTIEDLLYFLVQFEAGAEAADLDNGTWTGTGDGAVSVDDVLYFLVNFEQGC
jgi:Domain of unknown function (DUF4394)